MAVSNHTGWCLDERQEGEVQVQSQEEQPCEEKPRSERQLQAGVLRSASNHPEQRTGMHWFFPEASGRSMTPLAASLWTLEPPELWKNKLCCLKWPRLQLFVMGTLENEYNSRTNEMHRACQDTVRGSNKTRNSFCPLVFCELSMTSGVTSRHTLLE